MDFYQSFMIVECSYPLTDFQNYGIMKIYDSNRMYNIISLTCCDWHENAADIHSNLVSYWGPNRSHTYEGGTVQSACSRCHLLLAHCGLVMPHAIGSFHQQWFSEGLLHIRRQAITWSTVVEVMACCLTASITNVDLRSMGLWHSPKINFPEIT